MTEPDSNVVKSKDLATSRCDFQVAGTLGFESLLYSLTYDFGLVIFQRLVSKLYSGDGDKSKTLLSIELFRLVRGLNGVIHVKELV